MSGAGMEAFGIRRAAKGMRSHDWAETNKLCAVILGSLVLSIVPGLVQVLQHRFMRVWYYVAAWVVLLGLGLCFYGAGFGAAAIGIAVVLHAWIAADAAMLLKLLKRLHLYLMAVGGIAIGMMCVYWGINATLLGGFDGGYAGITVPYHNIEIRNYVLCQRLRGDMSRLRRGDMALVGDIAAIGRHRRYFSGSNSGEAVGQVVGLPGDTVRVGKGAFVVNDVSCDPVQFPVPQWIGGRQSHVTLGTDEYFVTMEYTGAGDVDNALRVAHVIQSHRLLARGSMLWLPLRKRGFLKEVQ